MDELECDKNKPIRFWLGPDADPAYQLDTNHKLFSLVEVCVLPNAILVFVVSVFILFLVHYLWIILNVTIFFVLTIIFNL